MSTLAVVRHTRQSEETGRVIAGVSVSAVGIVFAGVTAVTAQLSSTTRGANGLAASWAVLTAPILLGPLFGPTLGFPQWVLNISPLTHLPKAPAADVTATPVVALVAIGAALAVTGLVSLRRRNLALPA